MELRVMSFNVKRDFLFPRPQNRWEHRFGGVARLIAESGCAIIGVQELLPCMRNDLSTVLHKHQFLGRGRYHQVDHKSNEHADIIVDTSKASVHHCDTFWLSKEPSRIASRYLTAIFPRICTVAEVEINHQKIRVFNTHFDHLSKWAREGSVDLILKQIHTYNSTHPLPTIVMGDFNTTANSSCIQKMSRTLQNVFHVQPAKMSNTYHSYTGIQKHGKSPIDFIFVSDHFEVEDVYIINEKVDGKYPSDHFPILSILRLKQPQQ